MNTTKTLEFISTEIKNWSTKDHLEFILFLISKLKFKITTSWKKLDIFILEKSTKATNKVIANTEFTYINVPLGIEKDTRILKLLTLFSKNYEDGKSIEETGFERKILCLTEDFELITIYLKSFNTLEKDNTSKINEVVEKMNIHRFKTNDIDSDLEKIIDKFHNSFIHREEEDKEKFKKVFAGPAILDALIYDLELMKHPENTETRNEFIVLKNLLKTVE